jgi:hypothetical protein
VIERVGNEKFNVAVRSESVREREASGSSDRVGRAGLAGFAGNGTHLARRDNDLPEGGVVAVGDVNVARTVARYNFGILMP